MEQEAQVPQSPNLPGSPPSSPPSSPPPEMPPMRTPPARSWRIGHLAVFSLLGGLIGAGAFFLLRTAPNNGDAVEPDLKANTNLFRDWKKPDLAIVITGQMKGYLQPCGCSSPQYGGLARRFNFFQSLQERGWPVLPVDLGEINQETGPQAKLKYEYAMKSLSLMNYRAIGLGRTEILMPLIDALGQYSVNHAQPRPVAANLKNTEPKELFHDLNVRKDDVVQAGRLQVGVTGVVGLSEVEKVKKFLPPNEKDVGFHDNGQAIAKSLEHFTASKTDLNVLLYNGTEHEAKLVAKYFHELRKQHTALAPIHVIVCLSDQEEPPGLPLKDEVNFPNTCVITMGHKGRYVGVVGVWRTAKGYDLKYQLVSIGPEYETKDGDEAKNPISAMMEDYALKVKAGGYAWKYPRSKHPIQAIPKYKDAEYVGSDRCFACHDHATKVWHASAHSHAFTTLEKAKNPKHRQFDGECIACHSVGYKYDTGYLDPLHGPNFDEPMNNALRHVGCESCHGPGSEHVSRPRDTQLYPLMNPHRASDKERHLQQQLEDLVRQGGENAKNGEPFKQAFAQFNLVKGQRMLDMDMKLCQSCHDIENDVNWSKVGFETKWIHRGIIHNLPPAAKAPVQINGLPKP